MLGVCMLEGDAGSGGFGCNKCGADAAKWIHVVPDADSLADRRPVGSVFGTAQGVGLF